MASMFERIQRLREPKPSSRRDRCTPSRLNLLRLEDRITPSGEVVTAPIGNLSAGHTTQVTFNATVDSPLTPGINQVFNQGSVSGTGFTTFSTGTAANNNSPTSTAVDRAPAVAGVFVNGTTWAAAFRTALGSTFGYQVPFGANQLNTLPWTGIDRVSIRFTENVNVAAGDLQVFGTTVPNYALTAASFAYDPTTFTATWALATPVAADKLRLVLNATNVTQVNATNAADRKQLDGEWTDGTATVISGNGAPGGNFAFQVNVQPGDVNNDGGVNTSDLVLIRQQIGQAFTPANVSRNVNGDASIAQTDYDAARTRMFTAQPAGSPGGTPGSGWVAAVSPVPPTPGPAGTTITAVDVATLLTDVDADGIADPGDTIKYTVTITNTGADVTGVQLTDPLDARMTLVAGSVAIVPNAAPTLTALEAAALPFTENGLAAAVTGAVVVGDANDTLLTGATVQITGNYQNGEDVLAFANTASITGTFDPSNGKLTLTGTATLANYQAALRAVTYQNTSENPNTSARTLTFQVNDGQAANNLSTAVTRNINVTAVNDAPTLTGIEGTNLAYNQNTGGAAITSAIVVGDVDSANLTGATVSISAGFAGAADVLSFANQLGITGSYAAATGILTLSGTTTLANYQTALRAVQFTNTSGNTTSRTVSFQVNDGAGANNLSTTVTRTITINRAPVVIGETFNAVGNTPLLVGVAQGTTAAVAVSGSVLSNDSDAESNNPITINGTVPPATGTLSMNADGTFTYTPATTSPASVTFTYTAKDSLGAISQPATVTILVGTKVWYVDNTAAAGGDGRATTPFNTLAAAVTASGTGEIIFVNTGSGDTTAGIALKQNQSLIGRGVALQVDPDGGNPAPTFTLLAAGTAPTLVAPGPANAGVALNSTAGNVNTIRGLTIGSTAGPAITGNSFGTLNVDTAAITNATNNRTGTILDLVNGAVNATFTNLSTASSGLTGVSLINVTGSLSAAAGAISGTNGTAFRVGDSVGSANTGGTVTITYGGTIASGAGRAVEIQDRAAGAGNITFSGNLTHNVGGQTGIFLDDNAAGTILFSGASQSVTSTTAAAVSLTDNVGATINFAPAAGGNGLDISATSGSGFLATGGGTVTVTGTGNTIATTTGTAVNIAINVNATTIGAGGVTFDTVNVNGAANGILLDTVGAGFFTASGGSLANVTTRGVDVNGGSGNVTYTGTISTSGGAARSVELTGHTAGTVTFSGAITDTSTGINLSTNTGTTMAFTGGLSISTGTNAGFTATGGGTVTATQNNSAIVNTITTTTGTALDVQNTTIGASNLTFRSISAGTASGSGGVGILLNTTGSSGGLKVVGNGSAGSGGTIQHKTGGDPSAVGSISATTQGIGILMLSTSSVSLDRMLLHDFDNFAVYGGSVTGVTLNNSTVNGTNGNNNAFDEGGIIFDGLFGTSSFSSDSVSGSVEDNFRVRNSSGTANDIVISGCTFLNAPNDNVIIEPSGTAVVSTHITNNTFTGAGGDHLQTATSNTATLNVTFTGNFYSNGFPGSLLGGITISGGNAGSSEHVNFNVSNNGTSGNPLVGNVQGGAININEGNGGGTWQGQVSGNFIGNSAVAVSGSAQASGIRVENHSPTGTLTAIIDSNTIRQWGSGPAINSQAGDAGVPSLNGKINLTVTNNVATNPGPSTQHGFVANIGAAGTASGDSSIAALDIRNNTLDGNVANGGSGIRIRQRENSTIILPSYGGTKYDITAVGTYITGRNPGSTTANATSSAGPGYIGGSVPTPTLPPLLAAPGGIAAANPLPPPVALTQSALAPILAEAIHRWEAFGVTPAQDAALHAITVQIVDIGGGYLGQARLYDSTITLDDDAAGYGWFVDSTPWDDAEFTDAASDTRLYTRPDLAPAGRMDLLTTVIHELGHVLGRDSDFDPAHADDIMYAYLQAGERRLLMAHGLDLKNDGAAIDLWAANGLERKKGGRG